MLVDTCTASARQSKWIVYSVFKETLDSFILSSLSSVIIEKSVCLLVFKNEMKSGMQSWLICILSFFKKKKKIFGDSKSKNKSTKCRQPTAKLSCRRHPTTAATTAEEVVLVRVAIPTPLWPPTRPFQFRSVATSASVHSRVCPSSRNTNRYQISFDYI